MDSAHRLLTLAVFATVIGSAQADPIVVNSHSAPPLVSDGQSITYYGPHHFGPADPLDPPSPHPSDSGGSHYFIETGDLHHMAWFSATPSTPGPITIKYDFRNQNGYANVITTDQKARAVDALNAWSAATNGKVVFVQDTLAPASDIINIGTGDLAALGFTSGPGGTLALGGGVFTHSNPSVHSITSGVAWQDFKESWDTTIGNGNPSGTFDYFTVVAQEIGHALGLGHTDNTGTTNIMNGSYSVEQTGLSQNDIRHMQSIYGFNAAAGPAVPEPATWAIFGIGCGVLVISVRFGRSRALASVN